MDIKGIKNKLSKGEVTSVFLVEEALQKIEKGEGAGINAVITLNKEEALRVAAEADKKRQEKKETGELEGIPVAIKDVLCTAGLRTTASSKILDNFIPTYDATSVSKLKKAGAVIIAKTNCDEFAHGASGENSAYGPTLNPYDLKRVSGGSSSGSGAIVCYGGAVASLGTDTGGSTRAPASFLGLVGLKPTYGRVSRYGLMSMCSSIDTVAPITQNVEDAATMLSVISGKDKQDSTSSGFSGKNFARDFRLGLSGLKIAYPKEATQEGLDPQVKEIFFDRLKGLEKQGAKIEEISLPLFGEPAVAVYYILVPSEISSNLARFDGIKYGKRIDNAKNLKDLYLKTRTNFLGPEVKRRIILGNYSLSSGYYDAFYKKAQQVRRLIQEEAKSVFQKFDLIATPTMAAPAFKIGEKADPLSMYLADIYSCYVNLAGICAISVNAGWVDAPEETNGIMGTKFKNKLPIGFQLIGKWWDEETLLRGAYHFEKLTCDL
jgi:aspartyl-tRNA(Asn)/glutamyl-tRNA(Gln) amidotransferase subunit A